MRALRPTLARGAFLTLLLALGTAETCEDTAGLRPCNGYAYVDECGPLYSCTPVADRHFCVPGDPTEAAAVVGAYLNKRAQECADKGHEFSGKTQTTSFDVPGKPGCKRVIKQKVCRRCKSNITTSTGYEGDCGDLPPVTSCE